MSCAPDEDREGIRAGEPRPLSTELKASGKYSHAHQGFWDRPLVRRYRSLVHADLLATYSRDIHKWIYIAPILGVVTGLLITLITKVILVWLWPPLLAAYLHHPYWIIPGLALGFLIAGLLMQYGTPDPNDHSTEEIIRAFFERQSEIKMKPFVPKLVAAVATVGMGGSAALEGPSIYGGGALGSWMWARLRRWGMKLEPRDRRILLISGAAAGMSAVFRAPFTGVIFALEMPYKDDIAHEALMPALIASVIAFATLAIFMGAQPLFNFVSAATYTRRDLLWAALLGAICGLISMPFTITFRRFREFMIHWKVPHWFKMLLGGIATGICGVVFLALYHGSLVPLGPNYEAVGIILRQAHSSAELVVFGVLKLAATLFSLGVGGVSAMFVPLFLSGSSFGTAFAQSVVHSSSLNLFAAVGMASFIAAGYKTPLTAVVFVAEATGGHGYIVPVLIGAAVAYAVSGQASASGDQRLHEGVTVEELVETRVQDAMQRHIAVAEAGWSLRRWAQSATESSSYASYPVVDHDQVAGTIAVSALARVPPEKWDSVRVGDLMDREWARISPDANLQDALRLLMARRHEHLLLVVNDEGHLDGIISQTDILAAMNAMHKGEIGSPEHE
ncbi:MAG: chloride channel protein [Terriglobales bacterium]